ncbi:hypothetical protein M1843_18245 [Isoptericola sp. 4D.3]|uniref:Uncharacterized protein n=1 Tax=Isoptericola peretonis TaxID=2918523 RepID=A0ABT0J862_9MICO|nr:hypothetical protein [Isoptericola sp. 4D.3]
MSRHTGRSPVLRELRENSLSLAFAFLFLAVLAGQAFVGAAQRDSQQVAAGLEPLGVGDYVTSSVFWVDVTENWQSEFLQFLLFIALTVWFVQRGSPESKRLEAVGRETDEEQIVGSHARPDSPRWARVGGWRLRVYSHSLTLVMGAIFVGSWLAQSASGVVAYNEDQLRDLHAPVTWTEYIGLPDFWDRTLQNWQSELLAVLAMVVFSIFLRERGSPESKPVGVPHGATAVEG